MIKSKTITDHKLVENIHEESLQKPSQIRKFMFNRPDAPQCLTDNYEDVRTSEQHCPDTRSIIVLHGIRF